MENVTITPIQTILVANRGEIARRIMRTARDMGIATVAIYADGDSKAPFVLEADSAIALNGDTSAETYLDVDKVLDACRRAGADAIHPGYGFLSENQAFAQAVIDAGIIWIGPSPKVIGLMGDKLSAKQLMIDADVPTLPGIELADDSDLFAAANEIGYPVLVKASAGGGGRGMRVVEQESDLQAAVDSAKREAGSAFGDDTVFLEKWLAVSRHVEIQILGDTHGNLVHCFERECSIQRRHQKIIEEAPSPAVDDSLRERMGDAAITAAKKLGYASAGTVEFLLSDNEFYFLEVNARLQVEHPVTEEIIGQDLVREQIRVAQGEKLSFTQDELHIDGWAIEARLYAENPQNNFLPSPGTVVAWVPSSVGQARFESGVETGSVISTHFDPMIAKVIVHAATRAEAAARLARVLETTQIQGITTNRDFLVATLRTPEYIAGDTTTDFIQRVNPARTREITSGQFVDAAIAVCMEGQARRHAKAKIGQHLPSGWRNSTMPMERFNFTLGDEHIHVQYQSQRNGHFKFVIDEQCMVVEPFSCGQGQVDIAIDGRRLSFSVKPNGDTWMLQSNQGGLELVESPRFPLPGADDISGGLTAPMPGAVLSTEVTPGMSVEKGQVLIILEAMKMEHRITAPFAGTVEAIHVDVGEQVKNDQLMVTIEESKGN